MTDKPGGRKKKSFAPVPASWLGQPVEKRHEQSNPDSNPNVVQAVVRVVEEATFTHFYLSCGHLITVQKGELKGERPKQMECWACALEKEKA